MCVGGPLFYIHLPPVIVYVPMFRWVEPYTLAPLMCHKSRTRFVYPSHTQQFSHVNLQVCRVLLLPLFVVLFQTSVYKQVCTYYIHL